MEDYENDDMIAIADRIRESMNKIIDVIQEQKQYENNESENKIYDVIQEQKQYETNNLNEITIQYKIKNSDKITLFGKEFVNNNKKLCKMKINSKYYDLCQYWDKNLKENKIFEIKLKGVKNVTNLSHMFSYCESLNSLPDISAWDTKNVTNLSHMFFYCKSLSSLPDISKWNTKNVSDMSYMFHECESLNSLLIYQHGTLKMLLI